MGEWHEKDCGVAGGWPHDSSLCAGYPPPLPRLEPEDLEDVEQLVLDLRRDGELRE